MDFKPSRYYENDRVYLIPNDEKKKLATHYSSKAIHLSSKKIPTT
jgi:hypothetical protein